MSTTTRTTLRVLVATPLAAAALTVGGFAGAAHAAPTGGEPVGPGTIVLPMPGDPEPSPQGPGDIANPVPQPDPEPQGPGDITNPEPGDDPGPQIPGDKDGPNPGDGPRPEGPGDIAIPDPGDKPDNPGDDGAKADQGGKAHHPEAGHQKEGHQRHPKALAQPQVEAESAVPVPTRIDAGVGATEEGGLELSWLLAGGGIVTAAGSALARRRLVRSRR